MISKLTSRIAALHEDDAGEIPVGPLLIIGLIVVPLVLMLTYFRDELQDMFREEARKPLERTGEGDF